MPFFFPESERGGRLNVAEGLVPLVSLFPPLVSPVVSLLPYSQYREYSLFSTVFRENYCIRHPLGKPPTLFSLSPVSRGGPLNPVSSTHAQIHRLADVARMSNNKKCQEPLKSLVNLHPPSQNTHTHGPSCQTWDKSLKLPEPRGTYPSVKKKKNTFSHRLDMRRPHSKCSTNNHLLHEGSRSRSDIYSFRGVRQALESPKRGQGREDLRNAAQQSQMQKRPHEKRGRCLTVCPLPAHLQHGEDLVPVEGSE